MLFSGKTFKVPGAVVVVNIPGTDVKGEVSFSLKDRPTDEDPNAQDVNLRWNLSLPWVGELEDNRNLFPAKYIILTLQFPAKFQLIATTSASKSKFATEKSDVFTSTFSSCPDEPTPHFR